MPGRFEYERAIRRSDLPPLSRYLALMIATWADANTGIIAPQHQPSQSVLLQATGLGKGTFLTHRTNLVKAGWLAFGDDGTISRRRGRGQNGYAIRIPVRSGADPTQSDVGSAPDLTDRSAPDPLLGREPTTRVTSSPEKQSNGAPRPLADVIHLSKKAAAPAPLREAGLPLIEMVDHLPTEDDPPVVGTATIPGRTVRLELSEIGTRCEAAIKGNLSPESLEHLVDELDRAKRQHMQECWRCQRLQAPCHLGAPLVAWWATLGGAGRRAAAAPF